MAGHILIPEEHREREGEERRSKTIYLSGNRQSNVFHKLTSGHDVPNGYSLCIHSLSLL